MINKEEIKSKKYFDDIDWSQVKTKRFWYEDEPIVTHFFNALSVSIPCAEHFVVQAVKPYLSDSKAFKLSNKAHVFISEEHSHSLHHSKFNQDLKRHNYPVNFGLKFTKFGFSFIYKLFSKKSQLAMAVCFEHMTAVIAIFGFDNEIMKENISKVYDLFIWHAFEELNHRSVANELYTASGGGYIRRVLSMMYVTFFFIVGVLVIQTSFILSDLLARRCLKLKNIRFACKFFWGRKGLFISSFKKYFSIYHYHYRP